MELVTTNYPSVTMELVTTNYPPVTTCPVVLALALFAVLVVCLFSHKL